MTQPQFSVLKLFRVDGDIAIVTGAAAGIGRVAALALAGSAAVSRPRAGSPGGDTTSAPPTSRAGTGLRNQWRRWNPWVCGCTSTGTTRRTSSGPTSWS